MRRFRQQSQAAVLGVAAVCFAWTELAPAHPLNTSYFRLTLQPDAIETRFAFDATILERMAPELDADANGILTRTEMESALPVIQAYLRQHVFLDLDDQEAGWGEAQPFIWPHPNGNPIPRLEWQNFLVHFPYRLRIPRQPRHLLITCDVFIELGMLHKIMADLTLGDTVCQPAIFSLPEPDYLFDVTAALATTTAGRTTNPPQSMSELFYAPGPGTPPAPKPPLPAKP